MSLGGMYQSHNQEEPDVTIRKRRTSWFATTVSVFSNFPSATLGLVDTQRRDQWAKLVGRLVVPPFSL